MKKIAIQGIKGCFHQEAARKYFKEEIEVLPCHTFDQLARAVKEGTTADLGIMAIENSIAGSILFNYNLIREYGLNVVGEVYLFIEQNLMALPGTKIGDLKEVYSHPMAIEQSKVFFRDFPDIHLVESEDTAGSALMVKEKKMQQAGAIAGKLAAELYGLEILKPGIQTDDHNYTRFLILSNKKTKIQPEHDKASVYLRLAPGPGQLAKALNIIAEKEINLSKLQSFPIIGTKWQYFFHLDMEFSSMTALEHCLSDLSIISQELKVLGTYKKGL